MGAHKLISGGMAALAGLAAAAPATRAATSLRAVIQVSAVILPRCSPDYARVTGPAAQPEAPPAVSCTGSGYLISAPQTSASALGQSKPTQSAPELTPADKPLLVVEF